MGKRIVALALVGWGAIVALAWYLANKRIQLCPYDTYGPYEKDSACVIRIIAQRDYILTVGLTVALVFLILSTVAWAFGKQAIRNVWRAQSQSRVLEDR